MCVGFVAVLCEAARAGCYQPRELRFGEGSAGGW